MTDLDRETAATIEAFSRCIRSADPGMDADLLARELMAIARGRGWRPTEAIAPWEVHAASTGPGDPSRNETLARVRAERGWMRQADQPPGGAA